jgi:hypothetical protein
MEAITRPVEGQLVWNEYKGTFYVIRSLGTPVTDYVDGEANPGMTEIQPELAHLGQAVVDFAAANGANEIAVDDSEGPVQPPIKMQVPPGSVIEEFSIQAGQYVSQGQFTISENGARIAA